MGAPPALFEVGNGGGVLQRDAHSKLQTVRVHRSQDCDLHGRHDCWDVYQSPHSLGGLAPSEESDSQLGIGTPYRFEFSHARGLLRSHARGLLVIILQPHVSTWSNNSGCY